MPAPLWWGSGQRPELGPRHPHSLSAGGGSGRWGKPAAEPQTLAARPQMKPLPFPVQRHPSRPLCPTGPARVLDLRPGPLLRSYLDGLGGRRPLLGAASGHVQEEGLEPAWQGQLVVSGQAELGCRPQDRSHTVHGGLGGGGEGGPAVLRAPPSPGLEAPPADPEPGNLRCPRVQALAWTSPVPSLPEGEGGTSGSQRPGVPETPLCC